MALSEMANEDILRVTHPVLMLLWVSVEYACEEDNIKVIFMDA